MLVLTRKIDQGIVISGNIYVRVLGVERDRVKIGISAPLDVTILRQELLEREAAEGAAAEGRHTKNEGTGSPAPVTGRDEPKNDVNG
jgi:carbon storage regulator